MLSIIIVNYNSSKDINYCLESIALHEAGYRQYEFIIVDNDSHDSGLESVKKSFPFVRIIEAERNGGFAYGNNIGLNACNGSHILLLNPDTYVCDDSIAKMHDVLLCRTDIDMIGPMLLFSDRRNQSYYLPKTYLTLWRLLCEQFYLHRIFPTIKIFNSYYQTYMDYGVEREVEQISGAAMMFRREVPEKIGPLDDNYFMYFEESDYCYRAVKQGFRLLYYPQSRIVHIGGLISESNWEWSTRHFINSFKYFFKKNHGLCDCYLAVLLHIIGSACRFLILFIRKNKYYRYHVLCIYRLLNLN